MARFDVYPGARGKGYLLDCQADVLDHLDTRVVVPLLPAAGLPVATGLNPIFEVGTATVVMSPQLIFAIPVQHLDRRITSLSDHHSEIMNALDMLLTGY
ncbi:MAG: toxin CcdB [Sphingomonadales bacterium]|jgi:toxin CcdB|nr:toxin CcdB [Sphingomonadales bacterium]